MNKRVAVGIIVLTAGWALIIAGFLMFFPKVVDERHIYLNMVVSCLIFGSLCFDFFRPLVALDVDQPKEVGSLGPRWFFTYGYVLFALIVMIVSYSEQLSFSLSVMIHAVLLFIFIIGIIMCINVADKVAEVAAEENAKLDGRETIRRELRRLVDEASLTNGLPENVTSQLREIQESARFITPSDTADARDYEAEIVRIADDIRFALANYSMNEDCVKTDIARIRLALENRKKCLSRR